MRISQLKTINPINHKDYQQIFILMIYLKNHLSRTSNIKIPNVNKVQLFKKCILMIQLVILII